MGKRDVDEVALDVDRRELLRYALRQDYHRFIRHAWPVLEPGVPFVDGMPIGAVTAHVQALVEGTLGQRNLLINIPPRCMKSTSVSVALVPWVWGRDEPGAPSAHLKFLYTSYSGDLSNRDSAKARLLMASPWYRGLFGNCFHMTSDAVTLLKNSRNGHRLATSVTGKGTGEGGDYIVADDPHNAQDAESDVVRAGTVQWWRETMSTRGNDPETVKRIVVMQRLHEADLSGYILEEEFDDYVHLCLPMRYEPQTYSIGKRPTVVFEDPRKTDELLWPQRFSEKETAKIERKLGPYGAAGQFQQRPAPRGGGLIKSDYFPLWPARKALPDFEYILQSYDTALTDKTTSDDTACLVFGVFTYKRHKAAMILEAWDEKLNYPALRKKVIADWKEIYGGRMTEDGRIDQLHPGRRPDGVVVEEKGSGISIVQDMNVARVPVFAYNPGRADKTARVQQVLALLAIEVVWLLESRREPGTPVQWMTKAMKQWTQFPAAEHDDYVDTLTQGVRYLRDLGFFDQLEEAIDDEPDEAEYTGRKKNPYAQ